MIRPIGGLRQIPLDRRLQLRACHCRFVNNLITGAAWLRGFKMVCRTPPQKSGNAFGNSCLKSLRESRMDHA